MTKRLLAFILPLVALVSVTSCEDAVLAPDEAASQIEVVSGNSQSGRVSGVLASPVVVRVLNKSGTPVVGATVRFVPDTGSGSVSLETVLTDAEGRASVTWTLGSTFGTKTLRAEAGTSISVAVTATVVPDRLELVSGNNQLVRATGELPSPIVVQLVDLTGKPAVGVTVTFQPATGGGTVVPSVVATGTDGTARALWTLGSAVGPTTMRVSAASATSTLTINATATQDRLSVVSGGNQSIVAGATLPQPIVVQLRDQTGVAVKGVQVTFTPPAGSGTVSPSSVFTDESGQAQTSWTLGSTAGNQSVQVTGGSATAITVAAAALGADSLQVVSGNAQAGRAASPLASPVVVRVLDRQGRVVRGAVVRFAAVAGNGAPTVPVDTTDAQGLAETGWVLGSTLGAMQLTATVGTAAPVTISATTTQDRLVLESGGLQVGRVGSVLANPVVVQLIDLNNTPVTGAVITFTPDANNGTVLPVTVATDATGKARTLWTMGATAGPMTLRVTTPTSQTLVVNATAIEGQLSVASGSGQAALAGAALSEPIVVRVQDQLGNPLVGTLVTFAASGANGSVTPTSAFSDGLGLARTTWTLGTPAGAKSLTVTAGTSTLTVGATALTADSMEIVSGDAQAAQAGQGLASPVVVRVRDKASGRVVAGATVTFAPATGSGTVGATTVTTDGQGLAQTSWTLGAGTGEKTLTATAGTATVTFRAAATKDRLVLVSGGGQTARPGTQLGAPIEVQLFDINDRPMAGIEVSFTPDAGSGSTLPARVVTGSDGKARTAWTIGATAGVMRLVVSAGTAAPITVFANGGRDEIQLVSGGKQVGRVTRALADSIVVRVLDPLGQPSGNVSVTFAAAAGNGSPSPATVSTDAQGIAKTAWTLGGIPGAMSLTASALSATPVVATATGTQDFLELVSGGGQVRSVGAALTEPIAVKLRDQAGDSLVNEMVTFTAAAGSGSVSQASVLTDLTGVARTTWTLGATAGTQTLSVTGGVANAVTATATARQPDSLAILSGDAQAAQAGRALPDPVVVRVNEKSSGKAIPGATVSFVVTAANGSVSEASGVTDADGLARTTWTLGATTGAKTLTVSVGSPAVTRTVTATATVERLEIIAGANQTGRVGTALASPIAIRVTDLAGVAVPNVAVSFAPTAGSGTVLPTGIATDATGIARTVWTLGATAGTQTLEVSAGAAGRINVYATAAQNRVTLVSGGSQSARINAALTDSVAVKVVDPNGAAVPNVTVTFATASGSASPLTGATDAQGVVKTRWTLGGTAGAVSLTASAPSTDALTVAARALKADSVFLSAGGSQSGLAGAALPQDVTVVVRDRLSAVVMPGVTVTFAPRVAGSANDGTVSASTAVTDSSGIARTTWTIGTIKGTKTLDVSTADSPTLAVTATARQDTSRVFAIGAGNNQTGTVQRTLTDLRVTVRDRFNNAIVGDTIRWTDSLTNGITVSPTVSVTDANGEATTTPRLGVAVDSALVRARIVGRTETVTFLATGQVAYSAVQTGNFFSCALTDEGRSYCWGYNRDKQLAKSAAMTRDVDRPSTPITATDSLLGPFQTFRSLSLGRTHACGISVARQLICWGTGSGNFGTSTPTGVTFTPALTIDAVATGEAHTCFIDIDGFGWCGGENRLGQLGNRSTTATSGNSAVNVINVVGGVSQPVRLSAVSAGRSFTCGFIRGTTLPQCWGDNGVGQLGRASAITHDSVPANVSSAVVFDTTSLVTGLQHACALSTAGAAHCWGGNGFGQLGDGTTTDRNAPTAVGGGLTFVRLAAGEYHTCGITAAGAVYCWGRNTSGQLGDGTIVSKSSPTAVTLPTGVTFRALGLGELHSCAIAGLPATAGSGTATATGAVYCWGDNEYGQLGDGAASGNNTPVLTPKRVVNQP